jgi:hypothetical protein
MNTTDCSPWIHPAKAWKKNETTAIGSSAPDMAAVVYRNATRFDERQGARTLQMNNKEAQLHSVRAMKFELFHEAGQADT